MLPDGVAVVSSDGEKNIGERTIAREIGGAMKVAC
jgi:hypothetical protein